MGLIIIGGVNVNGSVVTIILSVIEVLISIALIVVILMQSKNASGLTGALGGMGQSNTYWDKNKGRSLEGKLAKYTKILATLFVVFALAISFVPSIFTGEDTAEIHENSAPAIESNDEDAGGITLEPNINLTPEDNAADSENPAAAPENAEPASAQ